VVIEHIEENTGPAIGSTFGSFDDDDTEPSDDESEDDNMKQIFLFIGTISAIASIALIVLLIKR
jgi:hypothetical protein